MYELNTPAELTLPDLSALELADVGQDQLAMGLRPALVVGGVTAGTFVLSMIGSTAIHRAKDRSWYCSILPSAFWSSLISGVAGGVTLAILAKRSLGAIG